MKPLVTQIDLHEYIAQPERQIAVLNLSLIFNDDDKQEALACYSNLIEIAKRKLSDKRRMKSFPSLTL